jgi:hypothetical protein
MMQSNFLIDLQQVSPRVRKAEISISFGGYFLKLMQVNEAEVPIRLLRPARQNHRQAETGSNP